MKIVSFRSVANSITGHIVSSSATLGSVGIMVMLLLITAEVISRKLFNYSTLVADELSAYLLVLITYLGLAFTLERGEHIQLKIVCDRLSPRLQRQLQLGWYLIGLAYAGFLSYRSLQLVLSSYRYGSTSVSILFTPLYLPQTLMLIGLSILVLQLVKSSIISTLSLRT